MVVSPIILTYLNSARTSAPELSTSYRAWHINESELQLFVQAPTPTPKTSALRHMLHRPR